MAHGLKYICFKATKAKYHLFLIVPQYNLQIGSQFKRIASLLLTFALCLYINLLTIGHKTYIKTMQDVPDQLKYMLHMPHIGLK